MRPCRPVRRSRWCVVKQEAQMDLNDPLFLVSRELDGDLTGDEQVRLRKLLAGSESLRAEAEKLRSVSKLVKRLAQTRADVDWTTHEQLVMAHVGAEQSELGGVDDLLNAMAQRSPVYDEHAFVDRVMGRIVPATKQKAWSWRSVARIGAPLAAAAVVVLAVTATWFGPTPNGSLMPVTIVHIGPHDGNTSGDTDVVVRYSRVSVTVRTEDVSESIGYMTLGSSPLASAMEESPL